MLSIVLLGTGNLAQHLANAIYSSDGLELKQVYGRNPKALNSFETFAPVTNSISEIVQADIYLLAVTDGNIGHLAAQIPETSGTIVHTSGAVGMDVIGNDNRGVFYPVQTFTKGKPVDFRAIPICIEANTEQSELYLVKLANGLSNQVYKLGSEQRSQLHLSAVFANNFSNYLFGISEEICRRNNIPFDILRPLILETALKVQTLSPFNAQTGPARRGDMNSIQKHLELITSTTEREIYTLLSNAIKTNHEEEL